MYAAEEKIYWFAISSRVFTFLFQCVANYIIIDHEPDIFEKPLSQIDNSAYSRILDFFTEGLIRWDAQYFLHISEYGYTYENTVAFFPLYPMLVRYSGYAFQLFANNVFFFAGIPFVLSTHYSLTLLALLINNVLFVHSALLLHKISLRVLHNERIAYFTALLFCINPASIFFSAAYSESLYFFLSLNAIWNIEIGNLLSGSILCGLTALTRSNGIINAGYVVYRIIKIRKNSVSLIFTFIVFLTCLIISISPFILHQFYCYTRYCIQTDHNLPKFIINYAKVHSFLLPGNKSAWCYDAIPFAYSYVQNHYWGVGFLKYYELKQVPNFILALPVILLTLHGTYHFMRSHGWALLYLGLVPGSSNFVLPSSCFPYILHNVALAVFGALFMHVQVSTRLIFSSCPAIYWFCARVVAEGMCESKEETAAKKIVKSPWAFYETQHNIRSKWKTLILTERFLKLSLMVRYYFFAYFLAGPVIFSNNLPWT